MPRSVEASAPARVCFGGESLDWMVQGPSVVGAIPLRARATIESLPTIGSRYIIYINSKTPTNVSLLKEWDELRWYRDPYLKYIESAIDTVRRDSTEPCSFTVVIESDIPTKAGVSSSAAVTLATIAAGHAFFGHQTNITDICETAYTVEREKLKTGAGRMDFYACGVGGVLFLNTNKFPVDYASYQFPENMSIVLVDTLTPHETKSFISSKQQRFQNKDEDIIYYADVAEGMVHRMHELLPAFSDNREEIGDLMTRFHALLRDYVGCSTALLDECVDIARKNGAMGAKLTGSGMGGCMFALVDPDYMEPVARELEKLPVKVYTTTITNEGVAF